ncbi:MAG: type II secretion system F family protein [Candidatus Rifleibacteriota bacterium]
MSDLRNFFLQLGTSLSAGLPLSKALKLLSENVSGKGMKAKIQQISSDIDQGMTFSQAIENAGSPFNKMHASFIKFGEQTGTLGAVCETLSEHAENEISLEREILSSLAYPMFLLFIALLVHPITSAILAPGSTFEILYGFARAIFIYAVILFSLHTAYKFSMSSFAGSFIIHIPFLGMIVKKLALCRFTRALGVGLSAGVPIVQALDTSIKVTDNPWLEKELESLRKVVGRGGSLTEGFKEIGAMPSTLKELVAVGEQSGKIAEMLHKSSDLFEEDARHGIKVLCKILPIVFFLPIAIIMAFMIISTGSTIFSGLPKIK